ncbi:MAG: molybdenum cofactor biosynthesis protein MoaE [Candidatus Eremiobacteraeota bacterium]|nr:molybdenum cofactor biosynthesis protein MoaE [Candidatus Eremiobacteraeota bacterium]
MEAEGRPYCTIVDAPLDVAALVDAVRSDAAGALVTFVGTVRESGDDGRAVSGLDYEAHHELALRELRAVAGEASSRFGAARVAIAHRIGSLALGEAAVAVVVASAHRGVAFDVCEFAIDELKRRVPIWKKEHYRDGDARWRENAPPG